MRNVFYRMGFTDQEIVALSGAHTLGRAKKTRSGFGQDVTKYTENGPGKPGGSSWTPKWLKFDNSYFTVGLLRSALVIRGIRGVVTHTTSLVSCHLLCRAPLLLNLVAKHGG